MTRSFSYRFAMLCLLAMMLTGGALTKSLWTKQKKHEDIYYAWVEGGRILNGENPYAKVLDGDMRTNQKYATYFPVFYELSALSQWAGLRDYDSWLAFWRVVFLFFYLAIAGVLFSFVYLRAGLPGALFAAAFWMFSRWPLYVSQVSHLDFLPIFFLLLSLLLFRQNRGASLLLYGLSLGLKQLAIFLGPLYLIWIWQEAKTDRLKQVLGGLLTIISVPLAASLPFLVWNAEGFFKSVLFSVTRNPNNHFRAASVNEVMGCFGPLARLPMLLLLLLVYTLAAKRTIGPFTACLFITAVFLDFSPVLFGQYLAWLVPLIPLAMCDRWREEER